jgi:uncharacterized membrane protein
MTAGIIKQTLFIYALTIVISMLVAYMIVGINKVLFYFEDAAKRRAESKNDGRAE